MLPRFRATGVAGTIGAAAAAAKIFNLDREQIRNALGCSAVFAGGFGAGFISGTMDVKLNVGMAARNGVSAALLARAGATASPFTFEGDAGFYKAMSNTADAAEEAVAGLGSRFLIEETVYKDYPVCMFVQTPVALAIQIRNRPNFALHDIRHVTITVPHLTYTNPGFTNAEPFASQLHARISAKFCVAAALLGRRLTITSFFTTSMTKMY
ncbi:MmgE/PrpD family protein [Paraburkholderia terrae]